MDRLAKFLKQRKRVDTSYAKRKRKEEKIWRGFSGERKALEKAVSQEFRAVLDKIGPIPAANWILKANPNIGNAEILDYKVEYGVPTWDESGRETNPGYFFIRITKMKFPDGTVLDNENGLNEDRCPHMYSESVCGIMCGKQPFLNPRIRDFMQRYNVYHILGPYNECHHQ